MSQQKDNSFNKQQGKGNRNGRRGQQQQQQQQPPKKPGNNYVPKTTTTTTNGSGAPHAPRPTQGAPFPVANGAPRSTMAQVIAPQRTQSAPPNLREQQQAPIFIPTKTQNAQTGQQAPHAQAHGQEQHAHPPGAASSAASAATAQPPSTAPQQPRTSAAGPTSMQQPVQTPTTATALPQSPHTTQQSPSTPTSVPAQGAAQTVPTSPAHHGGPHGSVQTQNAVPTPTSPLGPSSQVMQQAMPQNLPPLQHQAQPGQQPAYKYGYAQPYYGQPTYMAPMHMQQSPQTAHGRPPMQHTGYHMQAGPRHPGAPIHPGTPSMPPHGGVPMTAGLVQPGMNPTTMGPSGPPPGSLGMGMGVVHRGVPTYRYPAPIPAGRGMHTQPVQMHPPSHSVPIATPPRQTKRIAIINPTTGLEITHSPPKESAFPKGPEVAGSPPAAAPVEFQTPPPSKAVLIQAPPAGATRTSTPATKRDSDKPEEAEEKLKEEQERKEKEEREEKERKEAEEKKAKQEQEEREREEQRKKEEERKQQEEEAEKKRQEAIALQEEEKKKREQEEEARKQAELEAKKREDEAERSRLEEEKKKEEVAALDRKKQEEQATLEEQKKVEEEQSELKKQEDDKKRQEDEEEKKSKEEEARVSKKDELKKKDELRGSGRKGSGKRGTPVVERKLTGNKQPPKRKDVLKKADANEFSAAHFDAYSSTKKPEVKEEAVPEKKEPEPPKPEEVEETTPTQEAPAEEAEDDWEAKADDWEAKADNIPLANKSDPKDAALRPGFAAPKSPIGKPEGLMDPSWSQTPGGKKMYDRDFLLKFQPYCKERPNGLPPIEVILGYDDKKGPGNLALGSSGGKGGKAAGPGGQQWRGPPSPFMGGRGGRGGVVGMPPRGAPPGLPFRGGMQRGVPMNVGRGGPGRQQMRPGKKGSDALLPLPEMAEPAAGSWVPSSRRQSADPHADLFRRLQMILNKVTGTTFELLSQTLVEMVTPHLADPDVLKQLITIIFESALSQPQFSVTYAKLCYFLDRNLPTPAVKEGQAKPPTFKRFLLNRCQQEFEQKPPEEAENKDKPAEEEKEEGAPTAQSKKKRMIGNIVFIGELYKEKMLNDKIVHECVFRRLFGDVKNPVEEDIEAVCKLLTTIGKVLDTPKAKRYMDAYFKIMKTLSENQALPSRLRFLIIDVIDLRKNNWEEKKAGGNTTGNRGNTQQRPPTTSYGRGPNVGPGGRAPLIASGSARGNAAPSPGMSRVQAPPGSWEVVGSKRGGETQISPRAAQQPVVLGPNSQVGHMGSGGAKGWRPEEKGSRRGEAPAPARGNMFSALAQERKPAPAPGRPRSLSGGSTEEPSDNREDEETSSAKDGEESPEERVAEILAEFEENKDAPEETIVALQEMEAPELYPEFVRMVFYKSLEVRQEERKQYLLLLDAMGNANLAKDALGGGFRKIAENFATYMEDYPRSPQVFGSFVGHVITQEFLAPKTLQTLLNSLGGAIGEKVLGATFSYIVTAEDIGSAQRVAKYADITDPTKYLAPHNQNPQGLAEWLDAHKLREVFPNAGAKAATSHQPLDQAELQKQLGEASTPESVLKWIEANTSRDDPSVGGQVCHAVLAHVSAITGSTGGEQSNEAKIAEDSQMRKWKSLLVPLIGNNQQAQLACLFEVQRFCVERSFPHGFMGRIFGHLYTLGVIPSTAFFAWHSDSNASVPGKAQAIAEVSAWLNWLRSQSTTSE